MRRSYSGGSAETIIYRPTVYESAKMYLLKGEARIGLDKVVRQIEEEGWGVFFDGEKSDNTSSFSRKDGKKIIVHRYELDGGEKSPRHILASMVHEYLFGELTDEASKSQDPTKYIKDHYLEFAKIDVSVAGAIDSPGSLSETGLIVGSHRNTNLRRELTDHEIKRLLEK